MSKHRLLLDDDYEFLVFGISCHLKDYRVAWYLNHALKKEFVRTEINLPLKGGKQDRFPLFNCKDSDIHLRYMLLANQNEDVFLMKSMKQYDFFMFVEGYIEVFDSHAFAQQLQAIEPFQFVTPLDSSDFHHMQYPLFEE